MKWETSALFFFDLKGNALKKDKIYNIELSTNAYMLEYSNKTAKALI